MLPIQESTRLGCKVNFAPGNIPLGSKSPWKCIYSVPAQDTAKHHAKYGWRSLSDIGAGTKPTCETCWNLLGCPKLINWSQPLMDWSSPYCKDMWRRYCCLTTFFQLSIHVLVAKTQRDKLVWWYPDGEFLAILCILYFQRAAYSIFQTCILNLH